MRKFGKGSLITNYNYVICCLSMSTVFAYEAPITQWNWQEWEEVR